MHSKWKVEFSTSNVPPLVAKPSQAERRLYKARDLSPPKRTVDKPDAASCSVAIAAKERGVEASYAEHS